MSCTYRRVDKVGFDIIQEQVQSNYSYFPLVSPFLIAGVLEVRSKGDRDVFRVQLSQVLQRLLPT